MPRLNLTRRHITAQKKGICVAVIPMTALELIGDGTVTGAVHVQMPERVLIRRMTINVVTAAATAGATMDVSANGLLLADEIALDAAGVAEITVLAAAMYLPTGGELVLLPGDVTPISPADDVMVAELVVEYIELDKNSGEYTRYLNT